MNNTRRDCVTVIGQMIAEVPQDKINLLNALRYNVHASSYKAPEENIQWERTMMTLREHIPAPVEDWEFKVLSIFTTRSVGELKSIHQKS